MPFVHECNYQQYPCNYNNMVVGHDVRIPNSRFLGGYEMIVGAKLYVGTLPNSQEWWNEGPPHGIQRPGPFFTTVIKRAESFGGTILEYSVRTQTPLIFTGGAGGWETQEDVFRMGRLGYFSCKECEVSVQNDYVGEFVDWQNVRDITSMVRD